LKLYIASVVSIFVVKKFFTNSNAGLNSKEDKK